MLYSCHSDNIIVLSTGHDFPSREPIPGQPLYTISIKSCEELHTGDHILHQNSKPPFQIMYRSALVVKNQGISEKVTVIMNIPIRGVTKKQLYFDELETVHKVIYDKCRYSTSESIKRAKKRLEFKETCYHALFNNSHFFVTWCKTGREYPLTDILVDISKGEI